MKDKILAAIKAKFPKVNLSKTRLNAIAAKIETKVIDDETKIDAAIDEYNDFNPLSEIAKTDDKIRNLEAKKDTSAPAKKDEPATEDVELPDDTPAWAKALIASQKATADKLAALEGDKAKGTVRAEADKLLKDIPASYWGKRALPEKVEDLEAFVEEVKTDYTTFAQEMADKGLSIVPSPGGGSGPTKVEKIDPAVQQFIEKNTPAKA